jgi:hypothetical protein
VVVGPSIDERFGLDAGSVLIKTGSLAIPPGSTTSSRLVMGSEQKVAVITGASPGIGAGLVKGYHDRNYRIIATSRSIKQGNDRMFSQLMAISPIRERLCA